MLDSGQQSVDAGTWIEVVGTADVPTGQTVVVPYTISVSGNATPGDHAAGLAAELTPSAALDEVNANYQMSWNPFQPGSVQVEYTVRSTGNTRLLLTDVVTAGGQQAQLRDEGATLELLPGDERLLSTTVEGVWPFFVASVSVDLEGDVPQADGEPTTAIGEFASVDQELSVLAVPWSQLLVLAGLALLLLGNMRIHRNRKQTLQTLARASSPRR